MQQAPLSGFQQPMPQTPLQQSQWQGGFATQQPRGQSGGLNNKLVIGVVCGGGGILVLLILAIVIQSVISSKGDGVADEGQKNSNASGKSTLDDGWETFTSADGGFSVELPGRLDRSASPQHNELLRGQMQQVTADFPRGSATVTWAEVADVHANPDVLLDSLPSTLAARINGTLVNNKRISLQDHPGREFTVDATFEGQQVRTRFRAYLVNDKFYQINASWRHGSTPPSKDIDRTFNSFRLSSS